MMGGSEMHNEYLNHTLERHYNVKVNILPKIDNRIIEYTTPEHELEHKINQHIAEREDATDYDYFIKILFTDQEGAEYYEDAEVIITFKSLAITADGNELPLITFAPNGNYNVKIEPTKIIDLEYTFFATVEDFEKKLRDHIPILNQQDRQVRVLYITYSSESSTYKPVDLTVDIIFDKQPVPFLQKVDEQQQRIQDFRSFVQQLSQEGQLK
ncbi:hypothetical protein ACMA1I_18345 [Pontibacter sp. 13R65]|uniref:hypothetical protein n=1 Tax=Pontibacter sp. 13R65 TaxID=3127458 RepID=UPI00301DFB11